MRLSALALDFVLQKVCVVLQVPFGDCEDFILGLV
jgi:hypothetical protein